MTGTTTARKTRCGNLMQASRRRCRSGTASTRRSKSTKTGWRTNCRPSSATRAAGSTATASKTNRKGSLGIDVNYRKQSLKDIYTIYCHVDILCARNLPALDDNGLCDPCWTIKV